MRQFKIGIFFIFFSLYQVGTFVAQSQAAHYSFDDCTLIDVGFLLPDAEETGEYDCVCGLSGNAVYLDGINDQITFPLRLSELMDDNFTLDFYFWQDVTVKEMDLFANRNDCGSIDSLLNIRYFGSTNELLVEIGSNINNFFSRRIKLNNESCWHRLTLVKFNLEYRILVDNILMERLISRENIILSRTAPLAFAGNPCLGMDGQKYAGKIDEFKFIQRALSDLEITNSYLFPDQIVTKDTTLFKGESLTIEFGNTCASNVLWSPDAFLNDDTSLNPTATPDESTKFTITVDNGSCVTSDEINIFVADKEKLDCNNLLLPKAFTPNNDGLNDTYGISNTFIIEKLEYFEVYDRWGAKIWSAQSVIDQWDGTFDKQPLNPGNFLYKIGYRCNGEERTKINNFTLIR
ncbi:MAG: gliding motility-associated C-terminal domain-containing protein [Saprospiraceae bacterium]|nr:gliding motility-associated C-terminal domain-containing protein [Saprospiraceae bacterium]